VGRNTQVIEASPEAVWDVLADPRSYGEWVVGSSEIRDWDEAWPDAGTRFHHRVGVKPLTISDHTESVEADAPRRLLMRAKARPWLGVARVELNIDSHPEGSRVVMVEDPEVPFARWLAPAQLLIRLRNAESLRRLRRLAEARQAQLSSR
jgi:uncharacterized protein YndB with AHSA1/START domain